MHSHQGLQEQQLMAAPLIIHDGAPADQEAADQEIVMMLHDFSFTSPQEIFAGLRKEASGAAMPMNGAMPIGSMQMGGAASSPNVMRGMPAMGHDKMATMHGGVGMGGMAMGGRAMDLNDVAYDAFLVNDRTLSDPEIVRLEAGGRALLRIINGASAPSAIS